LVQGEGINNFWLTQENEEELKHKRD